MPKEENEKENEEFIADCREKIKVFLESDDAEYHFEPMNSYQRRLVHHLSVELNVGSYSEGERDKRHIVVSKDLKEAEKNSKSITPYPKFNATWDYGEREFIVNQTQPEVEIYLDRNGFIGVVDEHFDASKEVLDKKKVTSGIKDNKIVEFSEANY